MAPTILIIFMLIALGLLTWQVSNFVSVLSGSPFVVSKREYIREALRIVRLKKGELFYDLGCGSGDALLEAEKFEAQPVGFEVSPFYYLDARLRTLGSSCEVRFEDIRKTDLTKVDVAFCYLLPEFLKELSSKFKKEIKKGGRLVSLDFPVEGLSGEIYRKGRRKYFLYKF